MIVSAAPRVAAVPEPLSVVPCERSHESRCPPTTKICSGCSLPRISPTTFAVSTGPFVNVFWHIDVHARSNAAFDQAFQLALIFVVIETMGIAKSRRQNRRIPVALNSSPRTRAALAQLRRHTGAESVFQKFPRRPRNHHEVFLRFAFGLHQDDLPFSRRDSSPLIISMTNEDQGQLERLIERGITPRMHIMSEHNSRNGPVEQRMSSAKFAAASIRKQNLCRRWTSRLVGSFAGTTDNGSGRLLLSALRKQSCTQACVRAVLCGCAFHRRRTGPRRVVRVLQQHKANGGTTSRFDSRRKGRES